MSFLPSRCETCGRWSFGKSCKRCAEKVALALALKCMEVGARHAKEAMNRYLEDMRRMQAQLPAKAKEELN